jgi:hypothetical protein
MLFFCEQPSIIDPSMLLANGSILFLTGRAYAGSRTPFFRFWAYVAWYNAFVPVFQKVFRDIVNVLDEEKLDTLRGATVKL